MSKKQSKRPIFGNSIIKNLLMIILTGMLLILLSLLFLHIYTRHGQNVVVPKLSGLQIEEAMTILRTKGLHAEIVDSIYKRDAVPGAILEQTPKPGNRVKGGRSIYITVYSNSPNLIAVPELTDYSERQAIALLNSLGFIQLTIEEVPSRYSGLIMAIEYNGKKLLPEEKIPAGSPLKLIVSSAALTDSLSIEDEYIVAPRQTIGNKTEKEGRFDDTFF